MIFNKPIVLNAKMADEKLEKMNAVKEFKDCMCSNKIKNMRIKLNFLLKTFGTSVLQAE
jgi:hypothetical protein